MAVRAAARAANPVANRAPAAVAEGVAAANPRALGGALPAGRYRINARRLTLPATSMAWRSRAPWPRPANQPVIRTPETCIGGIVLEVEPSPMPADDFWWYHVEVLGIDLPAAEIKAPDFFAVPRHQSGEAFPPPDRLPPVIALVRLTQAQFRNWLTLLEAPPYPTLEIDAVAATVLLERSDLD